MSNRKKENSDCKAKPEQPGLFGGKIPQTILELVLSLGGGWIPDSGEYRVYFWSLFLGKTEETVHSYVKKYSIPTRKPGDETYIDAADFRACVPKQVWGDSQ